MTEGGKKKNLKKNPFCNGEFDESAKRQSAKAQRDADDCHPPGIHLTFSPLWPWNDTCPAANGLR